MSVFSYPLIDRPARGWEFAGGRAAQAWHLLSLDAPTVAALWAWFLARSFHLHLPGAAVPLLALATWLLYVADRLLDGVGLGPLQERHRFHQRHRAAFVSAAAVGAAVLVWGVLTRLPAAELRAYAWLGAAALLYLLLVHAAAPRWSRALPKELVVAVVFALATAVPAWSLHRAGPRLVWITLLFGAACWLNCVAIEIWENPVALQAHASTRALGRHLRLGAIALAVAASTALPASAAAALLATALLFCFLDAVREHLTSLHLRIAADAALLTPLLFLRW